MAAGGVGGGGADGGGRADLEPRPAATVLVVRDGAHPESPLEVLMLRRSLRAAFVGGAHVFPGGVVDPSDADPRFGPLCAGVDDARASATLGIASGGLAYWVAAVRECFEEAGLLLAETAAGPMDAADPAAAARLAAHREALNAGRATFAEICTAEGLRIAASGLHYFAHWITPEGSPRRYDTRFFVAAAPLGQTAVHDAAETISHVWVRPHDALERHRAGTMELILPTIRSLQAIGRFPTAAALLDAASSIREVPAVLPRLVSDTGGVRLLLPGDPGYDDVLAPAAAVPSERPAAAVPSERPAPVPDTGRGPEPVPGRVDELLPGLRRLTAPNPGVMTGPGTNTYLVGTRDVAVVDPGPDDPVHLAAVADAVAAGGGTIRWVLVTHTHPDHAPGAARLAAEAGAMLIGHRTTEGFAPDVEADDGWTLEGPSFALRALHTPGHASDHVCWLLDDPRVLLSGDHLMDRVTVVVAPPDGDMAQYLSSLRRVEELDPPLEAVAPGHGRLLGEPAAVVRAVIGHRLARERLVADALAAAGTATLDELVGAVYADVDAALFPVARLSLWAHLRKLADEGRAEEVGGPGSPTYRSPTS